MLPNPLLHESLLNIKGSRHTASYCMLMKVEQRLGMTRYRVSIHRYDDRSIVRDNRYGGAEERPGHELVLFQHSPRHWSKHVTDRP